jgi:hypothetical protein
MSPRPPDDKAARRALEAVQRAARERWGGAIPEQELAELLATIRATMHRIVGERFQGPYYILGPDGEPVPVDPLTMGLWLQRERAAGRLHVGDDTLPDGTHISTVFLGIDHDFTGRGPPILFETMVFAEGKPWDGEQQRYASWVEAEVGHAAWVARLRTHQTEEDGDAR